MHHAAARARGKGEDEASSNPRERAASTCLRLRTLRPGRRVLSLFLADDNSIPTSNASEWSRVTSTTPLMVMAIKRKSENSTTLDKKRIQLLDLLLFFHDAPNCIFLEKSIKAKSLTFQNMKTCHEKMRTSFAQLSERFQLT
jgi:hypothetical protein